MKILEKADITISHIIVFLILVVPFLLWFAFSYPDYTRLELWIFGVFVSLIIGHYVGWGLLRITRRHDKDEKFRRDLKKLGIKIKRKQKISNREREIFEEYYEQYHVQMPGWLVGFIERLVFTLAVAVVGMSVITAIIGWIGIKMVTGWSRAGKPEFDNMVFRIWKDRAFSSLYGNLVSMSFAVLGGIICRLPIKEVSGIWEGLPWWLKV